jgi:hypothetical protein
MARPRASAITQALVPYPPRERIKNWIALSTKERERKFSPYEVRKALDDLDGFKEQKRAKAYKLLSGYAAHVSREGFSVISPDGMAEIGPFPSAPLMQATIEELVKVLPSACFHIGEILDINDLDVLLAQEQFITVRNDRFKQFFAHQTNSEPDGKRE